MQHEKVIHDFLMENRPEGADHDVASCSLCKETASHKEEGMSDKMLTHEQHEALMESAVQKAVDEASLEARAEADAEVLSLNEKLATAEQQVADLEAKIGELEGVINAAEEAKRLDELADERVELVKAAASFSDEQIANRRERWAKMTEEEFNAALDDYRDIAKASVSSPEGEEKKEVKTSFDGTRETASEDGDGYVVSAIFKGLSSVDI